MGLSIDDAITVFKRADILFQSRDAGYLMEPAFTEQFCRDMDEACRAIRPHMNSLKRVYDASDDPNDAMVCACLERVALGAVDCLMDVILNVSSVQSFVLYFNVAITKAVGHLDLGYPLGDKTLKTIGALKKHPVFRYEIGKRVLDMYPNLSIYNISEKYKTVDLSLCIGAYVAKYHPHLFENYNVHTSSVWDMALAFIAPFNTTGVFPDAIYYARDCAAEYSTETLCEILRSPIRSWKYWYAVSTGHDPTEAFRQMRDPLIAQNNVVNIASVLQYNGLLYRGDQLEFYKRIINGWIEAGSPVLPDAISKFWCIDAEIVNSPTTGEQTRATRDNQFALFAYAAGMLRNLGGTKEQQKSEKERFAQTLFGGVGARLVAGASLRSVILHLLDCASSTGITPEDLDVERYIGEANTPDAIRIDARECWKWLLEPKTRFRLNIYIDLCKRPCGTPGNFLPDRDVIYTLNPILQSPAWPEARKRTPPVAIKSEEPPVKRRAN